MPTRRSIVAALPAVGLAGCVSDGDGSRTTGDGDGPEMTGDDPGTAPTPPDPASAYWQTHPQPTGNRTLTAAGDVRGVDPVMFVPDGRPQWLVAHPADRGSHWTVVTDDGRASLWRVVDGGATREREYDPLPPGTPPVVATDDGESRLVSPPAGMADLTAPAVATEGDPAKLLYVDENGRLVVVGDSVDRLPLDALPDGRLAAVGDGRYALFGDATDRYTHGALGDVTEGSTLFVVDTAEPSVVASASVDPPAVFEGLQPLVADLDGDGDREIVTTVADSTDGARVVVFDPDGTRLATGPIHEPGWRHQLTVAPFGPDGRPELAVVRKPHVDKLLELYRLRDGTLSVAATADGFSTHTYGSRITDGAVAADFDDDGETELLLPTGTRTDLAAVRHEDAGAEVAWRFSLDGAVRTNLTGIGTDAGVAVGAGVGGSVHVWQG